MRAYARAALKMATATFNIRMREVEELAYIGEHLFPENTYKSRLSELRVKHEVACSTLEIVKEQRTIAQRALAAQCEETKRLRAAVELSRAKQAALTDDQVEQFWYDLERIQTSDVSKVEGLQKTRELIAALSQPAAQSAQVPEGWQLVRRAMSLLIEQHKSAAGMFPQVAEEHREDIEAIRHVIEDINFYEPRIDLGAPQPDQGGDK
jgi:hypothetical protein